MSRLLGRAGGATLLVALVVVAFTGLAHHLRPRKVRPLDIEGVIVSAQLERAESIPPPDLLVIGDSSALMDVDPVALGERLGGRKVESLAMLAWVSPAGFASVLERASSRGAAGTVLVLMNGESLRLPEATFAATGYEKMVLEGAPAPRFGPLRQAVSDVRGGLFHDVIRRAVAFPLPGTYGRAYGGPDELAEALAASHGGVVDPNRYKPQAGEYLFEVSDPVSRRLLVLRDAIRHCGAGRTRLGLTPIPEGRVGPRTVESRRGVLERLRRQLGLPVEAIVETPVALPDSMFATATHLAAPGRAKFTAAVAAGLGSPR